MSCSQQQPAPDHPEDLDSSDYGSDFSPDEEAVLDVLNADAVAEYAALGQGTASSPLNRYTPAAIVTETAIGTATRIETNTSRPELFDRQPGAQEALIADIEDGLQDEDPPALRLPRVLGREMPRSPWRQSSQQLREGPAPGWSPLARAGRAGQGTGVGVGVGVSGASFGMFFFRVAFPRVDIFVRVILDGIDGAVCLVVVDSLKVAS